MTFDIEIRNKVTGRAVTLAGKQAVADFLAGLDKTEWEGYACLGELPEPTQLVKAESDASPIVDTSVDPILPRLTEVDVSAENPLGLKSVADAQAAGVVRIVGEGYTLKTYGESVGVTETGEVVLNPEVPAAMAAVLGDLTLSVGDSGAGDSYLPADAAGEQA